MVLEGVWVGCVLLVPLSVVSTTFRKAVAAAAACCTKQSTGVEGCHCQGRSWSWLSEVWRLSFSLLLLDFPNRRWWVHFSVFSRVLLELSVVGFLVVPLDVVLVSLFCGGW